MKRVVCGVGILAASLVAALVAAQAMERGGDGFAARSARAAGRSDQRSLPSGGDVGGLSGAYLGQTPPGAAPEVFAPGIVSTDANEHMAPSFSPDGSEVFWWANRPPGPDNKEWTSRSMTMRRENGRWSASRVTPFGPMAAFSPDGRRLYFGTGKDIWYVEKQGREWGEPRCLNLVARFPELQEAHMPRIAANGTLYFIAYLPGVRGNRGIYRAQLVDGEYARPEALPSSINLAPFINWAPFIAPDESYLLFSSNRAGSLDTAGDLYLSRRLADGGWADPVSLGEPVNTRRQEVFPGLSPDGRYLFFCRDVPGRENDVYWVSAATIPALRNGVTTRRTGPQGSLDGAADLVVFRRSPRILQIRVPGLGMLSTNIVVVATQKGLVVIDTWHAPFVFEQVARIAEKEFGRSDFAYVINSHEDVDHSSGNGFFEGATLVAQRHLLKSLEERQARSRQWESWYRGRIQAAIAGAESRLAPLDSAAAEASKLAADLQMTRRLDRAFEAGFAILPARPKGVIAFEHTYSLALGDLTVECFATRFGHTPSDLFIHIPEEGFLFTGDVSSVRLPRSIDMPHWLALLAFLGGFSAAAGMVMVESIAVSTMLLNHVVMPIVVRLKPRSWFPVMLINLKRMGIFLVVLLGYFYQSTVGETYMLVNMGLISFAAAAQFAPALIGELVVIDTGYFNMNINAIQQSRT